MSLPVNEILHGDCIEVLPSIPENSIDLIFADPPYNLQLQNDLYRPNNTKVAAVNESWDKFESFAEYDQFTRAWLTACRRVLKSTGTIWVIGSYHNIFRVGTILQDLGFWILNDVIWIKNNPMPNFRGVRFTNAHETMIWAQKEKGSKYTFNHQAMKALNGDLQMRSDWFVSLATGKERVKSDGKKAHSAQKPEALLYRVLLSSSNPGDVVLDPFFGSGTTGVVAKKLNRSWIGIECDQNYIKVARRRIDKTHPFSENSTKAVSSRKLPRVPFGALVEIGWLTPGEDIIHAGDPSIKATVLANGQIKYGDETGSIHKIARIIASAPVNGWEKWMYIDKSSGDLKSIDELREKYRTEVKVYG